MEQTTKNGRIPVVFLLKGLFFAYALTGVLLALLSFLLYKFGLGEKTVAIAIIVIYVAEGAAYFIVLALISFLAGDRTAVFGNTFFTTLALCAGGGMLGGMLG